MLELTRIHDVVRDNYLERDEWYLVHDSSGRRYVLFETSVMDTNSNQIKKCKNHQIAVQTILSQNNELSRKLKSILEIYVLAD